MELKLGYKQTEVGVIPEDWALQSLEQIADPKRPIGYGIVQTGRPVNNGVRCLRVVDILGGTVDTTNLITTSPEISNAYRRTILSKGDLVIALRGKIGAVAVIEDELVGANLTRGVALLAPKMGHDSHYLCHALSSPRGKQILEKNLNGSALQEIPIATLRKIPAPIPPLPEQQAIAGVLGDVDALIGALDRLIAKKRDLKQAAMQQLLTGQTRLPGFSGKWEMKRLDDLGRWKGGLTPSMSNPGYWHDGDMSWASSGDIKSALLTSTGFKITRRALKETSLSLLSPGAILVVTRSGILRKFLPVSRTAIPIAVNQDIKALVPGDGISSEFVQHALIFHGPAILGSCLKAGTTVESVEFPWFKQFELDVPEEEEQTAIASVLSDMDAELSALAKRRDKTHHLKQGMMQELLTGRIRLS